MICMCQNIYVVLTTAIIVLFGLIYTYFRYAFTYWERKGVPTVKPSFPFGNVAPMFTFKKSMSENVTDLYNQIKTPLFGMYVFATPRLVIKDPQIVKMILVKDFQHFTNRGNEMDPKTNALHANLFTVGGSTWKTLRSALTPAFTSGKLKLMMETIVNSAKNLQDYLNEKADKQNILEFKDLAASYTTDIIASVAMGIEVNSICNPNEEFREMGRIFFDFSATWYAFKHLLFIVIPEYIHILRITITKPDIIKFMMDVVEQTVNYRENNNVVRNDFLQILIQMRNSGKISDGDDMKVEIQKIKQKSLVEITADVFFFFLAGFETSSSTMSSFFYEMARNPGIMREIQAEVDACIDKHGGFTYEAMSEMVYLENCINETLRLYTVLPFLIRESSTDYKIPGHNIVIPKGMKVLIPIMGLHRDPQYFPDPLKFDPDRFSDERKGNILPYTFIPFGEGPRACIGMRLGRLQVKVGLAMVLRKFDVLKCSETSKEFQHDPTATGVVHLGGIWLQVAHRR